MKCNKPRRTPDGPKKFVVKACQDCIEKIIRFGDSNMRIKKSNPKARNHSVQGTNAARLNPNLRPDIGHAGTGKWQKVQKSTSKMEPNIPVGLIKCLTAAFTPVPDTPKQAAL